MFRRKFVDNDFFLKAGELFDPVKVKKDLMKPFDFLKKQLSLENEDQSTDFVPEDAILARPYRNFSKLFEKMEELGSGSFGKVYKVKRLSDGKLFACKEQLKSKILMQGLNKLVVHEELIMSHLKEKSHKHVVTLEGSYEDEINVYFVMDICARGDILQTILKYLNERGCYTEKDAASICRKMFQGIKFCHDNGVIHRDIKPDNFLWTDEGVMKVTDFGLSCFFKRGEKFTNTCGTPPYVSPEMWQGKEYDEKVDVWALGITMVIMLIGKFPFNGEDTEKLRDNIVFEKLDVDFFPYTMLSTDCRDLIVKMLKKNPDERITLEEAMEHPWVVKGGTAPDINLKTRVDSNMKLFLKQNDFLYAAMNQLAKQLNTEEIEGIRERFKKIDVDKDGKLTFDELFNSVSNIGRSEGLEFFQKIDQDNKGYIDIDEFVAASLCLRSQFLEDKVIKTFGMLANEKGLVTKEKMRGCLDVGDLSDTQLDKIYNDMDTNCDGVISFDEFKVWWQKNVANNYQIHNEDFKN